jgi:hydroxymethylglutaryl-CoA reductase
MNRYVTHIPIYKHFRYRKPFQNIIIPIKMAGPLMIDGIKSMIPMPINIDISNSCKALNMGGGVSTAVYRQSVSQIKIILCPNVTISKDIQDFIITNYSAIESLFNSTSISTLQNIWCNMGGRNLYIRISYTDRDMKNDAVNTILQLLVNKFKCVSINTNICCNNVNWIKGSGISISADCTIPHDVVKNILNTTVDDLIKIHNVKMVGNAMMGSNGASKIAAYCFLAIGQTNNLNVQCITVMNKCKNGLYISVTIPSLEMNIPSEHTARMIASTVMAGELVI